MAQLNYDTNGQNPHTIRLPVKTENCQIVTFNQENSLNDIKIKNNENPLTHYLKLNTQMPMYGKYFITRCPYIISGILLKKYGHHVKSISLIKINLKTISNLCTTIF